MGRSKADKRACPFCKKKIAGASRHARSVGGPNRTRRHATWRHQRVPFTATGRSAAKRSQGLQPAASTRIHCDRLPSLWTGADRSRCQRFHDAGVHSLGALRIAYRGWVPQVRSKATACERWRNLALGWWCFPWGIATPIAVFQNLIALMFRPPGVLNEALSNAGIYRDDVLVDEFGLTGEERRVLWAVLTYTGRLISAGGDPRIIRAAADVASQLSGGAVGIDDALAVADEARTTPVAAQAFDSETCLLLLRVVADLATRFGPPSTSVAGAAERIGDQLGADDHTMRVLMGLEEDHEPVARATAEELTVAFSVLGVEPDAPIVEVRSRYRALMLESHPDHASAHGLDEASATAAAQRLNWAYHIVMASQRERV